MSWRARLTGMLVLIVCLGWSAKAGAFVLIEDHFDVSVSTVPSMNPPITNNFFFRGYSDPAGGVTGDGTPAPTIDWGSSSNFGLLLPAVTNPLNEKYALVGMCDGSVPSVIIAIDPAVARTLLGNSAFDFQTTFGMTEASVMTALQAGDTNTLIALLRTADQNGLLPAVQFGAPSPGELVSFSTPTDAGTISVVETLVPEPASAALLLPLGALALQRRRRRA